jgi:CheY-like chemotaxis protein
VIRAFEFPLRGRDARRFSGLLRTKAPQWFRKDRQRPLRGSVAALLTKEEKAIQAASFREQIIGAVLVMKRVGNGKKGPGGNLPRARQEEDQSELEQKTRVLVVDDEPAMREILSLFLGWKGLEVKTAQNPGEALRRVSEGHLDLVILDWDLAGVEALNLLNYFKGTWPQMPVIIFTGKEADEAFLKKALTGRADAILPKLGSLDALWKEVVYQLTKNATGEESSRIREI